MGPPVPGWAGCRIRDLGVCQNVGLSKLKHGQSQRSRGDVVLGTLRATHRLPLHPDLCSQLGEGCARRGGVKPGPARYPSLSHTPGHGMQGPKPALACGPAPHHHRTSPEFQTSSLLMLGRTLQQGRLDGMLSLSSTEGVTGPWSQLGVLG